MKSNLLPTLCLALLTWNVNAQTTFQKIFSNTSISTATKVSKKTSDNGFIIGGWTQDSLNIRNAHLLKIDSSANILWSKTYVSFGNTEVADIVQTDDNGFILLCNILQGAVSTALLIRTNSNGNILWTKSYGDGQNLVFGNSVIQTSDQGFLVTGRRTNTFGVSYVDIYVIKTDSIGNPIWNKTYSASMPFSIDAGVRSIQLDDSGFVTLGELNYASGEVGCLLIRLDSLGNSLWSKNITTLNFDLPINFEHTNDGGYIITGKIRPGGTFSNDIHLLRTDSTGNLIWSKIYSSGIPDEEPTEVHQTSDGGFVVVGSTFSWGHLSAFLIKTDSNGDTLWTKGYGDGSTVYSGGNSVIEAGDGGYLLTGLFYDFPPTFSSIHLIKTDSVGNSGCQEQHHPFTVNTPVTLVNTTSVDSSSGIIVNSNSITVNTFFVQPITLCPVGIDEMISHKKYSVHPNPVESFIYFSFQNEDNVSFSIKNILGQIIYQENCRNTNSQNTYKFDLSFLQNGIYLVEFIIDGERSVERIVKE